MMKNAISLLIVLFIAINCNDDKTTTTPKTIKPPINPLTEVIPKSKTEIYAEKLEKIKELQVTLGDKKKIYQEKIDLFNAQIKEAQTEIKERITGNSIDSYTKAENDQVVNNNLQVIQKADAYITLFTTAIKKITTSEIEMARLEKLTKVDFIAVQNLDNDDKFAELLEQIDKMINEAQPNANDLATPKEITPNDTLNGIWQKYFQDDINKQREQSIQTEKRLKAEQEAQEKKELEKKKREPESINAANKLKLTTNDTIYQLFWNKNDKLLAILANKEITIWDPFSKNHLPLITNGAIYWNRFHWSQNENNILYLFQSEDEQFEIWDVQQARKISSIKLTNCPKKEFKLWNNKWVILECTNGSTEEILILNNETFSEKKRWNIPAYVKKYSLFVENDKLLISYFTDNKVFIEDLLNTDIYPSEIKVCFNKNDKPNQDWKSDQQIAQKCSDNFQIEEAIIINHGKTVVVKSNEWKAYVWDREKSKLSAVINEGSSSEISWSNPNSLITLNRCNSKYNYNIIDFFHLPSNKMTDDVSYNYCQSFQWHPYLKDWYFVDYHDNSKNIFLISNIKTGKKIFLEYPKDNRINHANAVSWSNSNKYVAMGFDYGIIIIWPTPFLQ